MALAYLAVDEIFPARDYCSAAFDMQSKSSLGA